MARQISCTFFPIWEKGGGGGADENYSHYAYTIAVLIQLTQTLLLWW